MKKLFAVMLSVLLLVAMLAGCRTMNKTHFDLSSYDKDREHIGNAMTLLPELSELEQATELRYAFRNVEMVPFQDSFGYTLLASYSPEAYAAEVEAMEQSHAFLESPVTDKDGKYLIPQPSFLYKGFSFRVVPDPNYAGRECKSILALGTNDETRTIAYLYFYDFDLDYICEAGEDPAAAMQQFLDESFSWPD